MGTDDDHFVVTIKSGMRTGLSSLIVPHKVNKVQL